LDISRTHGVEFEDIIQFLLPDAVN